MFDPDEKNMAITLWEMHRAAVEKCHMDRNAAKGVLESYITSDRRFDQYDPSRLIERIEDARCHGRSMDLADDPWLLKNGQKRPLSW